MTKYAALFLLLLVRCGAAKPVPEASPVDASACLVAPSGGANESANAVEARFRACQRACLGGDGESCRFEAAFLRTGRATPRDTAGAARAAERGCELGSFRACGDFAGQIAVGEGLPADPARALDLAEKSCAQGYEIACQNVGVWLETGNTGGKGAIDLPRAYVAYVRACELGQPDACHRAGLFAEQGRGLATADSVVAFGWYVKAWQKGHRDGCLAASRLLLAGRASWASDAELWDGKLFDAACQLGDQPACVELGWRLWLGRGLDPDETRAATLAAAACPTAPAGCALAGFLRGDVESARTFLAPRCTAGDATACEELALVLAGGRPEDRAWAAAVAHGSCARNIADMCGLEAVLMSADKPVEALALHEKACAAGHAASCHAAGVLLETDPGQVISKAAQRTPSDQLRLAVDRYVSGCQADDDASCTAATRLVRDGWDQVKADDLDAWRVKLFEHTCQRGDPGACGAFALELYRGRGVLVDHGRAYEIGKKACDDKDAIGCLVAGSCMWRKFGDLGKPALAEAIALFDSGCSLGNREACAWAGVALTSCRTAPCDRTRGKSLLAAACRDKIASACTRAEALKQPQVTEKDAAKDGTACERGDGRACLRAGDFWREENGWEPAKSDALYERGCDLKVGAACRARGLYVPKDEEKRIWFRRACDLRDARACAMLVDFVPLGERASLRDRACELGDGASCGFVGSSALNGWSRPVDAAEGERLLKKACDLGEAYYCGRLAFYYSSGTGLKKDPTLAKRYSARACALGSTFDCEHPH